MDLVLPKGAYHRANGNLPPFELVNMFVEATPSAKGGLSLLSFPGLASTATRGTGPINGIYRRSNLFGGATFTVSNGTLYKDGTSLGAINGTGPVWWASSDLELTVGRGQSAYSYNGTNLQAIAFPDGANVTSGTFLAGLFVFARASSHKFYWSAVLDARTIDPLDFASAESLPDWLRDTLAVGDALYLGGGDSIEAWVPTGDGTLPFQRVTMRTTSKGIVSTGCFFDLDNALHFVGSDRIIYRMGDVPLRISNHGIEEQLASSATFKLFGFYYQGHAMLCVRLDSGTWGFDVLTGEWHERRTWGLSNWIVGCAAMQDDGTPIFGSAVGDDLLIHSGWAEGTSPLSREFTAAVPLDEAMSVDEVEIEANTGAASLLAGDNPQIEMRTSRDRGNTWGPWRAVSLGATGQYRKRPNWRRCGTFGPPGMLCHFRCTDPVPLRVSGASGEQSSAGRARAA
jgi:hypothetical protein